MKNGIRLIVAGISLFVSGNQLFAQEYAVSDSIARYFVLEEARAYREASRIAIGIGDFYAAEGDLVIAKKYFEYALSNSKKSADVSLQAMATYKMGSAGLKSAASGRLSLADEQAQMRSAVAYYKEAHRLFIQSNLRESYYHVLNMIEAGETQYSLGDVQESVNALRTALQYAQKEKFFELAMRASSILVQTATELGQQENTQYYESMFQNYRDYFESKDSLVRQMDAIEELRETQRAKESELALNRTELLRRDTALSQKDLELMNKNLELENQRQEAERKQALLREKELEIRNSRLQNQVLFVSVGLVFLLFVLALVSYRNTHRSKARLEKLNLQIMQQKQKLEQNQKQLAREKDRVDKLLLNILPAPVADELKKHGKVQPRLYKQVSVVFTDFKGFTRIASLMSPGEIVSELEIFFSAFDSIVQKFGLEKIKTIGDGYMCAGGVPLANDHNPVDAVNAALEMLRFTQQRKSEKLAGNQPFFDIRIGINTGSVVAGVVGRQKFVYDIWGDAVNLASRMESAGEPGKITISDNTYRFVKDHFFCTYRGKIAFGAKAPVDAYVVQGRVLYSDNKPAT